MGPDLVVCIFLAFFIRLVGFFLLFCGLLLRRLEVNNDQKQETFLLFYVFRCISGIALGEFLLSGYVLKTEAKRENPKH